MKAMKEAARFGRSDDRAEGARERATVMASVERTKVERFLPYRHERFGLEFGVSRVVVDGLERTDLANTEGRIIALEERRAEEVELDLAIVLEHHVVRSVLPEAEREGDELPLELFVAVRCPRTRLRRRHVVASPATPGIHFATVTLRAEDVAGVVELVPFLVRTAAAPRARGYASHAGARLAGARPWVVRFDLERRPNGQYLEIRYEPFSSLGDAARWKGCLHRLDAEQDPPILWLNSEHREITEVLDSKATTGRRARLRDVLFDGISRSVWAELFAVAAEGLLGEGGYSWCDGVLARFLPELFPELADHEARIAELRRLWGSGRVHVVLTDLHRLLQRDLDVVPHMTKLIAEAVE